MPKFFIKVKEKTEGSCIIEADTEEDALDLLYDYYCSIVEVPRAHIEKCDIEIVEIREEE